jgi:hypothetical protein
VVPGTFDVTNARDKPVGETWGQMSFAKDQAFGLDCQAQMVPIPLIETL